MINAIISAIGNNNSIYPLLIRDCGIEVPTKVYKTYKQNSEDKQIAFLATRERLIDEYLTSTVWLGVIPLIGTIYNKLIRKRGLAPEVNIKLLQNEIKVQELDAKINKLNPKDITPKLLKVRAKYYLQSLSGNIEKFSKIYGAANAVKDLNNIKNSQNLYKKMQERKLLAQITLPIALMGFVIPKAVYAMTAATRKKKAEQTKLNTGFIRVAAQINYTTNAKNTSFGNNLSLCNLSTVQKMAITDGGYAVGRVTTARKKKGAVDIGFKMAGMLYLNFVAPKQIEKLLSAVSKTLFNLDVKLDPIILGDKEFLRQINNNSLKLPWSNNIAEMLNFVDNQENSEALFVKYAKKLGKIKMIKNTDIRDPRAYVEESALAELRDNMEYFKNNMIKLKEESLNKLNSLNISCEERTKLLYKATRKYLQKARAAKTFNIISNVALSSYLLACVLPDAQFFFREKILGTKLEPDLL